MIILVVFVIVIFIIIIIVVVEVYLNCGLCDPPLMEVCSLSLFGSLA